MFGVFPFGEPYFGDIPIDGSGPVVVGPGDLITTARAHFHRTMTGTPGVFGRERTAANASFHRTMTAEDTER